MSNSITKAFTILSIWAFPINGNAQTFESPKTKKLQIGISTSQYSFFDGEVLLQNGFGSWYYWFQQTHGYEAIYFFNKNGIRLSYNKVEINYMLYITHPKPIGSIDERDFILYNLEYLRKLYTYKKLELHLSGGMTYRKGSEDIITGYDYYGAYVRGFWADAFGLSLGTYIVVPIFKGLNVNLGFKYTEFIHRRYTGGQFYFEDDGSSKHMFGVTLGLGYTFSFKGKD